MSKIFIIGLLLCGLLAVKAWGNPMDIPVSLSDYAATNIPEVAQYLKGKSLAFETKDAAPANAAYFFLRYRFTIPPESGDADYHLVFQGSKGPGSRGQSNFSWVIDGGDVHSALRLQRVLPEVSNSYEHVQPPIRLSAGDHTLELRFYPDQRLREMNRATEAFVGHHVNLQGLAWRRTLDPRPSHGEPLAKGCVLRHNDVIVLFGDSITEEEYYARHLARLLNRLYPESGITVYNAGISLNRSVDGVARLDQDVLALSPDWAVLAFGVNDAMQLAPETYASNCDTMVRRMQEKGTRVLCASPTGMMPYAEGLGEAFFSMHASDRASAIDRSMALNAGLLQKVAQKNKALFADTFTAFTRTSIPRFALMSNQWHPNTEGGRMFAIALLRAWGISENDLARSGDIRDLTYYRALNTTRQDVLPAQLPVRPLAAPLRGTVVFGAAYGENRLLVHAQDGRQLAMLPTAHHPAAIAYARQRKELYVACEGSGILQVYALPALRLVDEIQLGLEAYPTGLALAADEATLFVAAYFGSKLIEIDLATRQQRREIPLSTIVNGVTLSPDGQTLVVTHPGKVAFVDPITGTVRATIETKKFTTPCLPMSDGKLAIIDAERWQMYPVDWAANKLGAPGPAPVQTRALAMDPATRHLFAGDWLNARLLEYDDKGQCLRATPLPAPVLALAVVHVE